MSTFFEFLQNYTIYVNENNNVEIQKWTNLSTTGDENSVSMAANGNKTYHVYIQAISSSGPGITSDMLEVPFIEEGMHKLFS